jgi:hypothetical protein
MLLIFFFIKFYSKTYVQFLIFLFVFDTPHSLTTNEEFENTKWCNQNP